MIDTDTAATTTVTRAGLPNSANYPMPTADVLPAAAVDWTIEPGRAALLIHDMQNHFLAPFSSAAEPLGALLRHAVALRDAAARSGVPVIYTAQPGGQDPRDRALLVDFWGAGPQIGSPVEITPELTPQAGDIVLTKWRYSAFQRTPLADVLRELGRDQLVVTGIYAHIGCLLTASEAFMRDVRAFVVADAVADFSLDDHLLALRYVARRCGRVVTTEHVLDALSTVTATELSWNTDQLQRRVGEMLGEPVDLDDDLIEVGLDSVSVMHLVEELRDDGYELTFAQLAETPTVRAWGALLER